MGSYPVGMGSWGDDFYTQQMYYNMANAGGYGGGYGGGAAGGAGATGGAGAQGGSGAQGTGKGFNFTKALTYAGVGGAATGAGMYFTNNQFNSPLESGKKVFTDEFMHHFSDEYAAVKNGDKLENFFKGLSVDATPVTAENYSATMESIEEFIKNGKVDELTDEAKEVLKKKFSLTGADDAALKTELENLFSARKGDMQAFFTDTVYDVHGKKIANNLNLHNSMLAQIEGLPDAWKDLGKGAESAAAKAEFLRENAHLLGMDKADYQSLIKNADEFTDVKALDDLWTKYGAKSKLKGRTSYFEAQIKAIKGQMQSLATKWDTSAGFFGTGKFKGTTKANMTALENALSSMRKCKAGKYAAFAAAGAAVLSLFV